jgi:hypothetical protein
MSLFDVVMGSGLVVAVLVILSAINLVGAPIAAIHCVVRGPEARCTAWVLVILGVPILGWISYWIARPAPTGAVPKHVPPPPPPRNIAAEIAAALEAERKQKLNS